ncbi:MAG TPA: hypothetical protein GX391_00430 [Firmicutes bacterium]|jgi:hypothetical protein|nr:hypothetical protein [Bacillota bacterium]HOQ23139.1 hypothetical protein [Bacillota bacterium]HPT67036.1 hypothetical protein [Bacillota bacterium]
MVELLPSNGRKDRFYLFLLGLLIFFGLALPLPGFAAREKTSLRRFSIPENGTVNILIPQSWLHRFYLPNDEQPPTVIFFPGTGDEFQMEIAVFWNKTNDPKFNTDESLQDILRKDMAEAMNVAAEKVLLLNSFKGRGARGFYFTMTNTKVEPDGYPYIIRGRVAVGQLQLNVTVLSRSKNSDGMSKAVEIMSSAFYTSY